MLDASLLAEARDCQAQRVFVQRMIIAIREQGGAELFAIGSIDQVMPQRTPGVQTPIEQHQDQRLIAVHIIDTLHSVGSTQGCACFVADFASFEQRGVLFFGEGFHRNLFKFRRRNTFQRIGPTQFPTSPVVERRQEHIDIVDGLVRERAIDFIPAACVDCRICVEACPTQVVSRTHDQPLREFIDLKAQRLIAGKFVPCAACQKPTAAHGHESRCVVCRTIPAKETLASDLFASLHRTSTRRDTP